LKTESVPVSSLVFDPANAREHDQKNLDAIKGSLARFGQQKPIVVGKNGVVLAGNGTLTAAKELGWEKIDIVRTDLTGAEATAFALADNRTAELARWNDEILGKTLQALREDGFDIGEIGFDVGDFWGEDKQDEVDVPEEKYELTVVFENDDQQQDLFLELRDRGFKVKAK
jgi:ParB-like chromosome segregation protein Spo0J